jgi:ABC-type antimicrobial peptide transport system permease subunit
MGIMPSQPTSFHESPGVSQPSGLRGPLRRWWAHLVGAHRVGVSATNPLIYVSMSLLLALVSLLAIAVPSSHATRVDPLSALRDS